MSRPSTTPILGQELKVIFRVDDGTWFDEDGKKMYGEFDPENRTITVLDNENWPQNLFHEELHACLHYSGNTNLLDDNTEESLLTAIEYGIFSIYKRDI